MTSTSKRRCHGDVFARMGCFDRGLSSRRSDAPARAFGECGNGRFQIRSRDVCHPPRYLHGLGSSSLTHDEEDRVDVGAARKPADDLAHFQDVVLAECQKATRIVAEPGLMALGFDKTLSTIV